MKKDANVYNAVCYDGVESYVIKTIGNNEEDVIKTFENTDLEVVKVDYLYTWYDMDKHIAGAFKGEYTLGYTLGCGDDLSLAIRRYIDLKCGTELACLDCKSLHI